MYIYSQQSVIMNVSIPIIVIIIVANYMYNSYIQSSARTYVRQVSYHVGILHDDDIKLCKVYICDNNDCLHEAI